MTMIVRRRPTASWNEIFDWLDPGWPAFVDRKPDGVHAIRIEERVEDGRYVLRAEIPGVDPEKGVEVTVSDGVLYIEAERREETQEGGRSEFYYGTFMRSVSLPEGAVEESMTATSANGVLEVVVPLAEEKKEPRSIPVARAPSA